ncbi:Cell division protein FtsN [compost metagenome]
MVVALYITKSPTPFQQKNAPRPSEPGNVTSQLPPPAKRADEGPTDPNKPLWSKTPAKPVGQAPEPEPKPGTQPSQPGQQNGHQNGQPPVAVTRPAEKPVEKPVEKPADKPVAAKPAEKPVSDPIAEIARADANKVGYLLQVGAFRSSDDADRQKANLAMQGFEARITERDVNGVKMYRVRMGPYNRIEDMNKTRERLQSQGFEASVIRFTKQ